jgi:hypothetical protein
VSVAQHPWEAISIDIVSASSVHRSGFRYILTCLDLFTRWVIAIPLKSKSDKNVSTAMFRHIFAVHGRPSAVRSNEGLEFVNAGLKYLYKHKGIKPISTGGYQSQVVPVERFHRFMNHSMTMLAAQFGEDWMAYLPAVTLAYNSSVTESTGYAPFALMYGWEPQLMGDVHMVLGDGADAPASTDSF